MNHEENQPTDSGLNLESLRAKLAGAKGVEFWRSLDEIAETEAFQKFLEHEVPDATRDAGLGIDRRNFLKLMGASMALAGAAGCGRMPQERVVPYVKAPEELIPGIPTTYATAMPLGGYAIGLVVKSHMGRPIKIEGNPAHPASLGSTDAITQASVLGLYDPDRTQSVLSFGEIAEFDAFQRAMNVGLAAPKASRGAGLRILTETVTSPTLIAQIQALQKQYPQMRWHQYEPAGRDAVRAGSLRAFGRVVNPIYRFDRADVILSLDADFLGTLPGHVRYSRDFIDGRRVRNGGRKEMNRLYVAESTPTITGAKADHRVRLKAAQVEAFARAVAQELGVAGLTGSTTPPSGVTPEWIAALARDLKARPTRAVVLAGDHQPESVHALAHAINALLGSTAVTYTAPIEGNVEDGVASLRALTDDLKAGRVDALLILGGNPAYTAPADLGFAAALTEHSKRRFSLHLGLYDDETSARCQWHVPETHYLEQWGDLRAFDGTISIQQPLIAPLYDASRSAYEILALVAGQPKLGYDIVKNTYQAPRKNDPTFDNFWSNAVASGIVPNTAAPAATVALVSGLTFPEPAAPAAGADTIEVIFPLDPHIWDGRFTNNPWLQETPRPLSKIVWDNAAYMSLATMNKRGLAKESVIELEYQGRKVTAAVWPLPGHPDDTITLHLGYGRERGGQVADGSGFNAYALRSSDGMGFLPAVNLRRADVGNYSFAVTQYHHSMEGRDIVRSVALEAFLKGETGRPEPGATALDDTPDPIDAQTPRVRTEPSGEEHGGGGAESSHGSPETSEGSHAETPHAEAADKGPNREVVSHYNWDVPVNEAERTDRPHGTERHPSLYDNQDFVYDGYAWGMSIDENACIGCNACSVACQAENNIAVVGKAQVQVGREMHWIRIDRYYRGDDPNAPDETLFQPVTCMHCEQAPCEPVCPVAATVHSHEGLNQMVYNRCIGTKYCSNNCPYKVRRFNFLKYTAGVTGPRSVNYELPVLRMAANPDVTVRSRGVMEKCTYCTQRISRARIESKKRGTRIEDGEVVPACAQACPTVAIVFGDLSDPNSQISKIKNEPANYSLLGELNTRPRTTYLPNFRNPNPEIERV